MREGWGGGRGGLRGVGTAALGVAVRVGLFFVLVRVRARHGVGGERGQVVAAVVAAVAVVGVVSRAAVLGEVGGGHALTLDLCCCGGEHVDVERMLLSVVWARAIATTIRVEIRWGRSSVRCVRVRW